MTHQIRELAGAPGQSVVFLWQRGPCSFTFALLHSRETEEVGIDHFNIVVGCHRVASVLDSEVELLTTGRVLVARVWLSRILPRRSLNLISTIDKTLRRRFLIFRQPTLPP